MSPIVQRPSISSRRHFILCFRCLVDGQTVVGSLRRKGLGPGVQGRQGAFEMPKYGHGLTLSLPLRLERTYCNFLGGRGCEVPTKLSHQCAIFHIKKQLPLVCSRCLSSLHGGIATGSGLDDEVAKVCKVIDELFALDRNMEAVLDECGVHLSHALVVEVLKRLSHARKPAFRFFNWAGRQPGFSHNSNTYNSMMTVLARNRQYESMLSLLEEIGSHELLTMETFVICIKAFAMGKERKKAVGMIELMKRYKFDAGVDTFNILLDSLGRAKLIKEAEVVFENFKGSFVPNLVTYTVLLNGWCKVKDLMEAGRVWNMIVDQGFKPDVVAFNVMIEGLLRCNKISDAVKLFEVMKAKGPPPDVWSYSLLINDLCKHGKLEEATGCFNEMLRKGCQPDAAVYTSLITGFGNNRKMDVVSKLLKEMHRRSCPPDGITYNAIIKLLTRQKQPDDAFMVFKEMIKNGFEPTIHSYNMIMKSYFEIRNYDMGRAVWDKMIKLGCCPDDNSYIILITGLANLGKSEEACKFLDQMLAKGMKVPPLDYNKLAAGLFRNGKAESLEELSLKMKSYGKFDASNIFMRWAQKMKRKDQEQEFLDWNFDQL